MGALFSPASDRRLRAGLIVLAAAPLLLVGGLMAWVRRPAATGQGRTLLQPIRFDHRIHVRGLGIDCRYCHTGAERAAYAGLPPTRSCLPCHNPLWLQSAEFAPVRASLRTGQPIPWQRVHQVPDFVFFHHGIHLKSGIGCASCHGLVDTMAVVRQVVPLTMGWCVDCHRQTQPPLRRLTHCTACHR